MTDVTVVVPVYNAVHVLRESIPAMMAQSIPAHWVFVNDGSTDGTEALLQAELAKHNIPTTILNHDTNRGRASARNTGAKAADTNLLFFMDADVQPSANFLEAQSVELEKESTIATVPQLEIIVENSDEPYAQYLTRSRRGPSQNHAHRSTPWKYFITTGCGIRKKAFDNAGGFDERITYGEDIDLAVRLSRIRENGLQYVPEAKIRMGDAGDLSSAIDKMREFGEDNLPFMVKKAPELAQWTGVHLVDLRTSSRLKRRISTALLHPYVHKTVRTLLPVLPGRMSNLGVRYLLGAELAQAYRKGISKD